MRSKGVGAEHGLDSIKPCSAVDSSSVFPVLVYLADSMIPRSFRHAARSEWLRGVKPTASLAFEMAVSRSSAFLNPMYLSGSIIPRSFRHRPL
jgi:hypothetical protein